MLISSPLSVSLPLKCIIISKSQPLTFLIFKLSVTLYLHRPKICRNVINTPRHCTHMSHKHLLVSQRPICYRFLPGIFYSILSLIKTSFWSSRHGVTCRGGVSPLLLSSRQTSSAWGGFQSPSLKTAFHLTHSVPRLKEQPSYFKPELHIKGFVLYYQEQLGTKNTATIIPIMGRELPTKAGQLGE